eukprot:366334-Chlamydomonas_euryale.AAC.4
MKIKFYLSLIQRRASWLGGAAALATEGSGGEPGWEGRMARRREVWAPMEGGKSRSHLHAGRPTRTRACKHACMRVRAGVPSEDEGLGDLLRDAALSPS